MVTLVARQGRLLQRYSKKGQRLVVGCVPYRFKRDRACGGGGVDEVVEVLVITSQKGHGLMFPKGGWELDETSPQAASREAMEEAGVQGKLECMLGKWEYKSKSHDTSHVGIMFGLNVTEELVHWPEMDSRNRKWVTVDEARHGCQQQWMKEALERLVACISSSISSGIPLA